VTRGRLPQRAGLPGLNGGGAAAHTHTHTGTSTDNKGRLKLAESEPTKIH